MPYENTWEEKGVYRKFYNGINGKELIQAAEDVIEHELFDSIRYVVNDLLAVTEHDVKTSDVLILAGMDRDLANINPNIKVAIIATLPTIQTLASLYGDLMANSPYPSKIFTNLDEARDWVS